MRPKRSKMAPRQRKMAPRSPKMAPRRAKMVPRRCQDGPRWSQDGQHGRTRAASDASGALQMFLPIKVYFEVAKCSAGKNRFTYIFVGFV